MRVEGVQFAAAHFATFGGSSEPLHGHSYEVAAELDGALSEESWVIDFIELKSILRSLCDELDHRFLLQTESRILELEPGATTWRIRSPSGMEYTLPASDVVALPIDNTTAERLAEWLCGRLGEKLSERGAHKVETITVEVWEGRGQRASHRQQRLPVD